MVSLILTLNWINEISQRLFQLNQKVYRCERLTQIILLTILIFFSGYCSAGDGGVGVADGAVVVVGELSLNSKVNSL